MAGCYTRFVAAASMKLLRPALIVATFFVPVSAGADDLSLSFNNGRVTLKAVDTPLREVLSEWARIGQTRIVGLEKLAGAPLTLELVDVPEKQALEILLRSIAGYLAAPRHGTPSATVSHFDRLALLPTSVAAPAPAGPPRRPVFAPPPAAAAPPPFPDPTQLANEEDGDGDGNAPPPPPGVPVFNPNGEPAVQPPVMQPLPPGEGPNPMPVDAPAPTITGPLTTDRPGILPVPQQPQQPQQPSPQQQPQPQPRP